jgi:hypothetical protein
MQLMGYSLGQASSMNRVVACEVNFLAIALTPSQRLAWGLSLWIKTKRR